MDFWNSISISVIKNRNSHSIRNLNGNSEEELRWWTYATVTLNSISLRNVKTMTQEKYIKLNLRSFPFPQENTADGQI